MIIWTNCKRIATESRSCGVTVKTLEVLQLEQLCFLYTYVYAPLYPIIYAYIHAIQNYVHAWGNPMTTIAYAL